MNTTALVLPILVVVVYLSALAALYVFQDSFVFQASGTVENPPDDLGWNYEDIILDVNGESTHGWYVHSPSDARGVVLFSHGNGGTISGREDVADVFRELGFDVLLYDYGGYGRSTGEPSEARCQADIRAMWDFLVEDRSVPAESIILFGRSMGGGPTCELATEVDEGAVLLESTFKSVPHMGAEQFPIFPSFLLSLLVKHRFDNIDKVDRIGAPLLVVHSKEDKIVPYVHGKTLFDAAIEPQTMLTIPGGHNAGFLTEDRTEGIRAFLYPLFPLKPVVESDTPDAVTTPYKPPK